MKVTADGWTVFEGGGLAKCVAPAKHPGDLRRTCHKWFAHVGAGLVYLVRIHPRAGLVDRPEPTRPDSNVHQCEKCGIHLEYRQVSAAVAVA